MKSEDGGDQENGRNCDLVAADLELHREQFGDGGEQDEGGKLPAQIWRSVQRNRPEDRPDEGERAGRPDDGQDQSGMRPELAVGHRPSRFNVPVIGSLYLRPA